MRRGGEAAGKDTIRIGAPPGPKPCRCSGMGLKSSPLFPLSLLLWRHRLHRGTWVWRWPMNMTSCAACGKAFRQHPQVRNQAFCSDRKCQRERKKLWQRAARQRDPDYRDNQKRAQEAWLARNPNYWREYRRSRPNYCEHNRTKQRKRDEKRRGNALAKMDVSASLPTVLSGIYHIIPLDSDGLAKMDSWTAEIRLISSASMTAVNSCKERT